MNRIFVFAGETSGDVHGAALLADIQNELPGVHIEGVFGPKMRALGYKPLIPMESFQVMGFSAVLRSLPRLWMHLKTITSHILKTNPDMVILIDYPDFNMRLCSRIREDGYKGKIVHYICPSVWAWKKWRIQILADTLDLLLCILPFEPAFFEHTTLPTHYVGSPSLEAFQRSTCDLQWREKVGIDEMSPIIAIFPGSRKEEILRNLPLQLESANRLSSSIEGSQICISGAHEMAFEMIANCAPKHIKVIPSNQTFDLMRSAYLALATCGTVALELALHSVPTVVTYRLSTLNALIGKYFFHLDKVPFFALPNILLEKEVFPELIHDECSVENVHARAKQLLLTPVRERCLRDCLAIRQLLHRDGTAAHNAAEQIASLLTSVNR